MTRVLFTHPSAELYGSDRTLLQLVAATTEAGANAVVALPRGGALVQELQSAGARVVFGELGAALRADLSPARFPRFLRKARGGARFVEQLVRDEQIDVVHTNTAVLLGAAYGAHRSDAAHAWHVHEILDQPAWANRAVRNLLVRWCDVGIANSRATASAMFDRRLERVEVIHNGVDTRRFTDLDPVGARARIGIDEHQPLVVLPGRINAWKGQRLLVEAVAILGEQRACPDAQFVIAGDAPPDQEGFETDLDAAIERAGVGARVQRVPFTQDLPSLLAAAEVCVVPSTRPEPFGLVAIEAMAAGTAVLAADHGGLTEIVDRGETGLRFEPGSAQALAGALGRLLTDDVLRGRLGAAGQTRQRERFTVERYTDAVLEVHRSLLSASAPSNSLRAAQQAA